MSLLALLAAAMAQAASAAPPPPRALNRLVESFVALCVEGRPNQQESARRALAAGWREVRGREPPSLPPGQRLSVMQKDDMIFLTIPPLPGAPTSLSCQAGANFSSILSLDNFASALAARLGPYTVEPFGNRPAAVWRLAPDFSLIAVLPTGDGPRTHQLIARTELGPRP